MNVLADSFPDSMSLGFVVTYNSFTIELAFLLVAIILLLIVSGLISSSEIAYFSLTLSDKNKLNKKNTKSGVEAVRLLSKSDYLLSTILFARGILNVAVVILSAYIINSIVDFGQTPILGFVCQIVVIACYSTAGWLFPCFVLGAFYTIFAMCDIRG